MRYDDVCTDVDSPNWLGCGVTDHDPECLCDVRCDGPEVPIAMRNLVTDLKYGDIICEIRGYTKAWTDGEILDYLSDVAYAHDEIRSGRWSHMLINNSPVADENDKNHNASRWKFLRETVAAMLQSSNKPKISQVLKYLDCSSVEFMGAATTGKYVFDPETLDQFEEAIFEKPLNITSVAHRFDMSWDTVRNLVTYWGILPKVNRKPRKR